MVLIEQTSLSLGQLLLNLNSLRLLKIIILLLERIIGDDLVIHPIVQLSIVVEFVLSINFSALFAEVQNFLLRQHMLFH